MYVHSSLMINLQLFFLFRFVSKVMTHFTFLIPFLTFLLVIFVKILNFVKKVFYWDTTFLHTKVDCFSVSLIFFILILFQTFTVLVSCYCWCQFFVGFESFPSLQWFGTLTRIFCSALTALSIALLSFSFTIWSVAVCILRLDIQPSSVFSWMNA